METEIIKTIIAIDKNSNTEVGRLEVETMKWKGQAVADLESRFPVFRSGPDSPDPLVEMFIVLSGLDLDPYRFKSVCTVVTTEYDDSKVY